MNGQRLALPRAFERVHPKEPSETRLWHELLKQVHQGLAEDEIVVVDAGVKLGHLSAAGIERYVLRLGDQLYRPAQFSACSHARTQANLRGAGAPVSTSV